MNESTNQQTNQSENQPREQHTNKCAHARTNEPIN